MKLGRSYRAAGLNRTKIQVLEGHWILEKQQLMLVGESVCVSGLPVVTVCRRGSNCDLLQTGSQADSAQDTAGKRPQASLPGRGLACTSPSPPPVNLRP